MDHAFTFASPAGAAVASALFGGIAAGLGVAVTLLLTRLAAPPDELSYVGTTPRARRAIGLAVALGLLILVWIWLWSGFYHLTIRSGDVELAYLAPPRTRVLPVSEIARVSWIPKPKNQRALVVTATDGTAYTSANTSLPAEDLALIQKAIGAAGSRSIASAIGSLIDDAADAEFGSAVSAGERQELKALYAPRGSSPLWVTNQRRLAPDAQAAISLVGQAGDHGLNPEHYRLRRLEELSAALDAPAPAPDASLARLDVSVSLSLLRLYRHLHLGRVDPRSLGFHIQAPPHTDEFVESVRSAQAAGRIVETAAALTCPLAQYDSLRDALRRYRAMAARGEAGTAIDPTQAVHPGETHPQLTAIRRLLTAFGDLGEPAPAPTADAVYAEPLVSAVVRFQRRHGLEPDGVLGRRTQAALAVPIDRRVRQIEMALERLRWLPDLGPSPLIVVNIPMFRLWAWDAVGRAPALSMNVVVGRALNRQTPVFMAEMPVIIFRPYWNVPVSIARAEFLPALTRDPDRLAREHLEVVGGGEDAPVLPASADALAQVRRGSLRLRQRPGPDNALGLLKFVFLNEHDVYMHGTPAQTLFARSRRDFSHGCIRVEDPVALAEWVLGDASTWPRAQVEAATLGADDRRVALPRPVQVLLFYVTAVVTPEDGWVHFADDIYGHDARLDKALALSYKSLSSSAPGRSQ